MQFKIFKAAVAAQFAEMQKGPLFRAKIDGEALWARYLESFPPGSNPVFRERTEYDCSCCRHFIRALGNVVSVKSGQVVSLWDIEVEEPAYAEVAAALSSLVKSKPLAGPFVHYEAMAGTDKSFEQLTDPKDGVRTWNHFFVNISPPHVRAKTEIPSWLGEQRARHDVLLRSLLEITADSIETVLELIGQGSLYRGEEQRAALGQFRELKLRFDALGGDVAAQDMFAWTADAGGAVSRIRNTALGSLLADLSEGRELEVAVSAFERIMAPANYKRPTALVTPAMVANAKEALAELGLLSALDRRFATSRDVNVGNVLFADRSARRLAGDVFDEVAHEAGARISKKTLDKVEEVSADRFLTEIVPRAESIEVLLENRHLGNLVSLIAPVDPTAGRIFKWDNLYSWSYSGDLADAIRERVKKAGGSVEGDLCCRLAWRNTDDLDFHMQEPGRYEIYYGNKSTTSPSGGRLDVDMNVSGETREPVENIYYSDRRRMKEGEYRLFVHQFRYREATDPGFEVEIDYLGEVRRYSYGAVVKQGQDIEIARFRYTHAGGLEILNSLPESQAGRLVWGLQTQSFHRVRLLLNSPNFWDGQGVGNRHLLFVLDGCVNDGSARGFFNEFLRADLEPHRKVFEVVGSKIRPAASEEQLSGLGFSSTRRDSVVCRIKGSFTRTVKVTF